MCALCKQQIYIIIIICMLLCDLIIQSINLPCSLGALVSTLVLGGFGASSHVIIHGHDGDIYATHDKNVSEFSPPKCPHSHTKYFSLCDSGDILM